MAMQDLMRDTVRLIKSDGQRFNDIKASVQRGKVFTADPRIPIEEGDVFERDLPSGVTEFFRVTDAGYYESTVGIPAHYQTRVEKVTRKEGQQSRDQPPESGDSRTKVFISYRRADTADVTGRIRDRLVAHLGADNVFMDVESIDLGKDFRHATASAIKACDNVLVVMCPSWLSSTDQNGRRRLDYEDDPVRVEIETALKQERRVIPLLAGGAVMPSAKDLPDSIRSFAFLNGLRVRPDPDFDNDMKVLLRAIKRMPDADFSQTDAAVTNLNGDPNNNTAMFSAWHQKRLEALIDIYEAFRQYLDFLRRKLYVGNSDESMDPMWEFRAVLDRNLVFLNDELRNEIQTFQSELLAFWNWAQERRMKGGEGNEKAVQHRLDFEVPRYLDKLRMVINSYADPTYSKT